MLDITPYESASGRTYRGKIAPFGEYVYAWKKPEKKTKAPWCGGIYLSKTRNDPRIIGLEDGVMRAGAIRRIGAGWRVEPVMRLTSTSWNISKPKGKFNPPALPEASMPALRNEEEEEATKPTVEIEDRNQAHCEVTKESRTAQPALPASVTERLPEPMEVEGNHTMLVDDSVTLEEFRRGVVQGSTPTEAGVSQEPKKQKVEPAKQAPTSR